MKIFMMLFKLFLAFLGIASCVYIYACYIEPKLLHVKKEQFEMTNDGKETLRVVQFTDTHLGEFFSMEQLKKVVEKINEQEADIVVFTGDLFDIGSSPKERTEVIKLLSNVKSTVGKLAIYGNRDVGGGMIRHYEDIMERSGFQVLKNTGERFMLANNVELSIFGLADSMLDWPDVKNAENFLEQDTDIRLLLLHEPDTADQFEFSNPTLMLAGHSHGGQVYLPWIGPLVTTKFAEKYVKDWYTVGNSEQENLFVSSGLGNTKLPFRFGNIPEIVVFEVIY